MGTAAQELNAEELPRLAVITDVGVERSVAGSLLLYRLLADYPPDRLMAIDGGRDPKWGDERIIPGVSYHSVAYHSTRLTRSRFNPIGQLMMANIAKGATSQILDLVRPFAPDIVLTVTAKYLWFPAAVVAQKLNVPLALILHDDWPMYETQRRRGLIHEIVRWICRRSVGRVYRQAAVRFCVSPGMEESCRTWFGPAGTLLYPSRGSDSAPAKVRVRPTRSGGPVVAFCGNIHQGGSFPLLHELVKIVKRLGGHLDLYTPYSEEKLASFGFTAPVVRSVGFLAPKEMAERLGETADVLFLPGSFDPLEREDVATLFPSKLTDYTATGLPILIWGPLYSSAARWVQDNPGAAEVIAVPEPEAVKLFLDRIVNDRSFATKLAERAVEAGNRDFGLDAARHLFFDGLKSVLRQINGN